MNKYACPICSDPNGFPLWIDKEPPEGCPHDFSWHNGRPPAIRNVSECKFQRAKAWQAAEFRRLLPDAFDATGNMLPGRLADVLLAFGVEHPGKALT